MTNAMIAALAAMFGVSGLLSVSIYLIYRKLNRDFEAAMRNAFGNAKP